MAGNIDRNLIWPLRQKTHNFITAKFILIRQCVGVHVRCDYHYLSSSES